MVSYLVVFEATKDGYSAYAPDIEGCVAAGETREETVKNMQEAIEFHLAGMREDGLALPEGQSSAEYVVV